MSGSELGRFIRSRREAIQPEDVGLPRGRRRRTPGLRRSELATIAGLSVEYLTRLEQGRDRHPSPEVLRALGDALRLSPADRELMLYAAKAAGGIPCPMATSEPPSRVVRPTVRALLGRFEPTPAYIANRLGDLLAYTSGFEQLVRPLGLLDRPEPNLPTFVFTDQRARSAFPEWDRLADELAQDLAVAAGRGDTFASAAIDHLTVTAGGPFADRIAALAPSRATVPGPSSPTGVRRLVHPEHGELRLVYETLRLPDADEQTLVAWLPADAQTSAVIDEITKGRPGALRVVGGRQA
ncbi:MAG TPA: helix-turn-helix transcriptional regulator [Actinopolymorphaceae bacterium]